MFCGDNPAREVIDEVEEALNIELSAEQLEKLFWLVFDASSREHTRNFKEASDKYGV